MNTFNQKTSKELVKKSQENEATHIQLYNIIQKMFHQGEKKEMCVNDHYDDLRKSPKKSWGPVKEEEEM
jgi:hypothetical protein